MSRTDRNLDRILFCIKELEREESDNRQGFTALELNALYNDAYGLGRHTLSLRQLNSLLRCYQRSLGIKHNGKRRHEYLIWSRT